MPENTSETLPLVGMLVQLGTSLFLTALFLSLRRESRRYPYFRLWTWGWTALSVALALLVLSDVVLPSLPGANGSLQLGLHGLYQVGKLGFISLVLLGTWRYGRDRAWPRGATLPAVLAVTAFAGATTIWSPNLAMLVAWQAAFDVPAFASCAGLLGTAPRARRGLGARVLIVTFALLALLWVAYLVAFGAAGLGRTPPWANELSLIATFNTYFDAVFALVLGLGMVVTVVEHGSREADAARQAQLSEIRESERRLAEILQAVHDGIVTVDADRRIRSVNPAAEAILGAPATEVVGQLFDRFLAPGEQEALWDEALVTTRRSEAYSQVALRREVTGVRAQGGAFPLEVALSSIESGDRPGYVIVLRDLSQREREREERDRLHQQVAQAARLESVGRMVSGVAHELNNPLTAILAFAQDLLFEARSDPDREALTVIVEQAQRCRTIVGDLLVFARSRRDERRRLAPTDLVNRVLRAFERDSTRHGVILDVDVSPDLPPAEVDPIGIEQVLTNLLTNAFQATPPGGTVTLRARARGEWLEFEVIDSGPGIAADVMPRLFEPFFTTKELGRGTGLGLSVSHAIVQQHLGEIRAENAVDGRTGARFVVSLPFVDRRRPALTADHPPEPPAPARADRPGRRILVVDDEETIRSAMRRSLERRGWDVDEATEGRAALRCLEADDGPTPYAAVVTDLRMPGMSGIEFYRELGARHPDVLQRTIVITGDTASPAVVEFLAGIDRPVLQKPFDMQALAEAIDRVVAASVHPA